MSTRSLAAMRSALSMTKQRCYNKTCRDYPYYGGRGITVCQRWLDSFEAFVQDMGVRPPGMTLEREDNDGPYCKENCVWATRKKQAGKRRVCVLLTHQGRTQTLTAWAEELGIAPRTLHARISKLGYSVADALTKPVKYGGLLPGKVYKKRRPPDMSKVRRGLDNPGTRLTLAQVHEMRRLFDMGSETYSSLARKYGVTTTTASSAVQGIKAYKDT